MRLRDIGTNVLTSWYCVNQDAKDLTTPFRHDPLTRGSEKEPLFREIGPLLLFGPLVFFFVLAEWGRYICVKLGRLAGSRYSGLPSTRGVVPSDDIKKRRRASGCRWSVETIAASRASVVDVPPRAGDGC